MRRATLGMLLLVLSGYPPIRAISRLRQHGKI